MFAYYRKSFLKYIKKVKALQSAPNNDLCLEIQTDLINTLTNIERRIRKYKNENTCLKGKLRLMLPKDNAKPIKQKIKTNKRCLKELKEIHRNFRDIGDAIAFIYIDKWNIKPMIFKEGVGHISNKKGNRLERKIFREGFSRNITIIYNDLTNCLLHGDLTIPLDGIPQIVEVKNSKHKTIKPREERQVKKVSQLNRYFLEDETSGLYQEKVKMQRVATVVEETNNVDKLNEGISKALKDGEWFAQVEKGLYYHVTRGEVSKAFFDSLENCIIFFINERKYYTDGHYPITLNLEDPEAITEFYAGNLMITVVFDLSVLQGLLKKEGLESEIISEDSAYGLKVKIDNSSDGFISFSKHIISRVPHEFLTIDWLKKEIVSKLGYVIDHYKKEVGNDV